METWNTRSNRVKKGHQDIWQGKIEHFFGNNLKRLRTAAL